MTLVGDTDHAHGGTFAAGGLLAADDTYAFEMSIWHAFPPASTDFSAMRIREALKLYELIRKALTDRVLRIARERN